MRSELNLNYRTYWARIAPRFTIPFVCTRARTRQESPVNLIDLVSPLQSDGLGTTRLLHRSLQAKQSILRETTPSLDNMGSKTLSPIPCLNRNANSLFEDLPSNKAYDRVETSREETRADPDNDVPHLIWYLYFETIICTRYELFWQAG